MILKDSKKLKEKDFVNEKDPLNIIRDISTVGHWGIGDY